MPELDFVLPHWLYWSGLLLFPIATLLIHRATVKKPRKEPVSLTLGYFLLLVGGFLGIHRLYLKSSWALAFVALFVGILVLNTHVRDSRDLVSGAANDVRLAEFKVKRAEKAIKKGRRNAEQKMEKAQASLATATAARQVADEDYQGVAVIAQGIGGALLLLMLIDALLLPRLVTRRNQLERDAPLEEGFHCPTVEAEHDDKTEPFLFNRVVSSINGTVGELVAYWSIIAVMVYYYEVIARYVFNSPTNWAHEGMFLMFGMQYLLAGGFVLREGAHVRVDVLYLHFSKRGKAMVDLLTSVFFFIFMLALLVTGWTFFNDSYQVNEVSFTEWAVSYWPIKFALPLGAALLLLQGVAQLIKDIAVVIDPSRIPLETETRPEG